nr:septum formation initiator family protein [Neorickettsia helminthoeca]
MLVFYCFFHTVLSSHSIMNAAKLKAEISQARDRIITLQKQKERLELDISLIVDEKRLDMDLLEEQSRKKFGLMKKGEKVIYHDMPLE